ncbi:mycothiol synthase [Leucobacter exalbidus]|uniref:Mycothiol synthase n=1 Tax=Leucobacter exalbidus TaxID=662960 RepID=A0A940T4T5_9MICO|nr:mycothiol synthase [Leucobacter exalbidus]MBP1327164.1 mycothiol synthase [Leucobacter exalbidus]
MSNPQLHAVTQPESLAHARALLTEIELADGASPVSDQAMLAAAAGLRELFLITAGDPLPASHSIPADLAGVGIIGEGELDLAIIAGLRSPEFTAQTLRLLLERAPGEVRSWVHGDRPETDAALTAAGFHPARSLYRMALDPDLLPTDQVAPLALPTPAGLRLRAFGAEASVDADAAAWVAANAAAFATHPEQGRITVADFAQMRLEPWFDSDDLLLLDAGGELAGSTWVKTLRDGGDVSCELYAVGVRPSYAGQGLGKLLLRATLARMAEHRPSAVSLYVDGDNSTAVGLYERAEFTIDSRSRQWLRPDLGTPSDRMDT